MFIQITLLKNIDINTFINNQNSENFRKCVAFENLQFHAEKMILQLDENGDVLNLKV